MKSNRKVLSWSLVILWMVLLFYLSHQPARDSNKLSSGVTQWAMEIVDKILPGVDLDLKTFNHIVRKSAHFFAYFVLGILALNALKTNKVEGSRGVVLAVLICILFAISDEIHQLYVPGRGGQIKDVLIDSAGSIFGTTLFSIIHKKTHTNECKKSS